MGYKLIDPEIQKYIVYNSNTGDIMWISKPTNAANNIVLNKPITAISEGYRTIKFKGQSYSAHRVAWFLYTGKQPENMIDHINGDKLDNSWDNLREATHSDNQRNVRKQNNNTSGYKGVSAYKNKWRAQIYYNNHKHYLGLFNTPEEAHAAYCSAAESYHGEFANYG